MKNKHVLKAKNNIKELQWFKMNTEVIWRFFVQPNTMYVFYLFCSTLMFFVFHQLCCISHRKLNKRRGAAVSRCG